MKTDILYLNGNYYENGKKSGEYFKKLIQENIEKYVNASKNSDIWSKCELVLNKLNEKYPEYVEEVRGKADGANVDFKAYWTMMCPEILDDTTCCTTIVCKDLQSNYMLSHNEDDEYLEGNFCLSKVYTKDNWMVTNDLYNMTFGNGISWNSHGIIKTINYCYDPTPILANIPRYFLQRHISASKSIKDLIKRCHDFHPASGFHVNAIDRNTNQAVSIEVYTDSVDVIHIEDFYIHSNHFIHDKYIDNPTLDEGSNGIFRLYKANNLFNKCSLKNIDNIREILEYRDKSNRFDYSIFQNEQDPYITEFNFSYSNSNPNKIYLKVYTLKEKVELKYDL